MSHFSVLVIGEEIEKQLAPYSEEIVVKQYIRKTKQQIINEEKENIRKYKETTYAKYLEDPVKYEEEAKSEGHIKYLKEQFPLKLKLSDEELYAKYISMYEEKDISPEGGLYSTYNPKSKWDYYEIGGRWAGSLKLKSDVDKSLYPNVNFSWGWNEEEKKKVLEDTRVDQARKGDIDWDKTFSTWAVLKDGEWHEKGEMGWFGMSTRTPEEEKEWNTIFYDKWIKDLPDDTLITVVDCHI